LDVLRPLQVGEPTIGKDIHPQLAKANRFGIDVIPGHPRLSILEDVLSESWGECTSGKIGGIRKTNWCSALHKSLDKDYDVAFFDIGPSLGSLNRSVLLGVQHFMSPVGADLFSVFGIRNIAEWLRQWLRAYSTGLKLAEDISPGVLDEYSVLAEPLIRKGFAGYTIQQYITKSTGGVRRATQAYERILRGIPNEVETSLGRFFATVVNSQNVHLGDVPHMYSLVPLAQSANAPIRALTSADGLAGSQFKQAEKYRDDLDLIVKSLAANIELPIGK
jgi:hypothetical protein